MSFFYYLSSYEQFSDFFPVITDRQTKTTAMQLKSDACKPRYKGLRQQL